MVDIKKILEECVERNTYKNLNGLMGMYMVETESFKSCTGEIFEKQREAYEEFKKVIPEWKEKYAIDGNTSISEILKKIS